MFFGVPGVWLALSDILMHKSDTVENFKSPHLVAVATYHVLFIFILRCLGISLVVWDSPFDLIFSDTYIMMSFAVNHNATRGFLASEIDKNFLGEKCSDRNKKSHNACKEITSRRSRRCIRWVQSFEPIAHRIHVWYIYLHLVDFYGRCR